MSCINQIWNWVSAFQGISLANCPIGIQLAGNADGGVLLLDSEATNVPLVFQTVGTKHIFIERFTATNVDTIVSTGLPGAPGATVQVPGWRQGPLYAAGGGAPDPAADGKVPLTRPDAPLPRRARPTFDGDAAPPVSATAVGAVGDGRTDCTAALRRALAAAPAAVFLPFGNYLISDTLTMPPNGALVGELGSVLLANGSAPAFSDAAAPRPLLLVPAASTGVRLVDLLFSATGPGDAPGLVFLDWQAPGDAPSGLWDVSWRLFHGAADLFLVRGEGAGVYWEEGWGWVADHDVDTGQSLTVKNPRGMTVTGSGESWLYGTAMEHSFLWQYNFSGCGPVTTIVTQTETDYWSTPPTGWAMVHENARVQMYGSGWYNWFNGNQTALWTRANSTGSSFLINVHGTNNVVVGDVQIPAYTPIEEEWFCDGFSAMLG